MITNGTTNFLFRRYLEYNTRFILEWVGNSNNSETKWEVYKSKTYRLWYYTCTDVLCLQSVRQMTILHNSLKLKRSRSPWRLIYLSVLRITVLPCMGSENNRPNPLPLIILLNDVLPFCLFIVLHGLLLEQRFPFHWFITPSGDP